MSQPHLTIFLASLNQLACYKNFHPIAKSVFIPWGKWQLSQV